MVNKIVSDHVHLRIDLYILGSAGNQCVSCYHLLAPPCRNTSASRTISGRYDPLKVYLSLPDTRPPPSSKSEENAPSTTATHNNPKQPNIQPSTNTYKHTSPTPHPHNHALLVLDLSLGLPRRRRRWRSIPRLHPLPRSLSPALGAHASPRLPVGFPRPPTSTSAVGLQLRRPSTSFLGFPRWWWSSASLGLSRRSAAALGCRWWPSAALGCRASWWCTYSASCLASPSRCCSAGGWFWRRGAWRSEAP